MRKLVFFLLLVASAFCSAELSPNELLAHKELAKEAFFNSEYDRAKWHFEKLATAGDEYGEFGLGLIYENGYGSTEANLADAVWWYSLAGKKNTENASTAMVSTAVGLFKLEFYEEAKTWMTQAARWGNSEAVSYLRDWKLPVPQPDLKNEKTQKERQRTVDFNRRQEEIRRLEAEQQKAEAWSSIGHSLGCALAGGCVPLPPSPSVNSRRTETPQSQTQAGETSGYYSGESKCYSDHNCGIGHACVKQPYKNTGVCMKSVDAHGSQVRGTPRAESIGPSAKPECQMDSDCPVRFKCHRQYQVCVIR